MKSGILKNVLTSALFVAMLIGVVPTVGVAADVDPAAVDSNAAVDPLDEEGLIIFTDNPNISAVVDDEGNVTIIVSEGYRIIDVQVNGESVGAVSTLTGLSDSDILFIKGDVKFSDDDGEGDWTWASEAIYACYEAGFISGIDNGDGTFRYEPAASLARAQASVLLAQALALNVGNAPMPESSDVAAHWAAKYIGACEEAGIFEGSPDDTITRAEFAVIVASALKLDEVTDPETIFPDDDGEGAWDWAAGSIYACQAEGIVKGDDAGNFNAGANIKRSEAAVMIAAGFLA